MPLITTTITPFTHTPSRQNPATFSEDMDYRLSEENSRITQMNNLGTQMNSVADLINDNIANIDLVADDIANVNIVAENIGSITSKIGTADIHNSTSKTTPSDSDEMALIDSASSFSLKKLTWANLKATLGTIFAPLSSPTFAGTPTVNGVAFSGYSGFKNYIINGKKQINQRGSTSTDNSYNQDRWYKVGNNWYQGIEGDNNLINGKTYTLSWVGNATASYYIGSATSATINSQSFTTIANGSSFTLTISAGQNLWIKFSSDATGSTFNFVQLEEGSVATPFEHRPIGLELSLCQRYYEKGYVSFTSYSAAGSGFGQVHKFNTVKRIVPTITNILNSNTNTTAAYVQAINTESLLNNGYATVAGMAYWTGYFTADAEL